MPYYSLLCTNFLEIIGDAHPTLKEIRELSMPPAPVQKSGDATSTSKEKFVCHHHRDATAIFLCYKLIVYLYEQLNKYCTRNANHGLMD